MEKIIYRKTLDVHKNGIQFTLQGFETADNLSRRIEINLMASGDTYELPLEGVVALMYITSPNAKEPSIEECTIKDNTIIYDVLPIVEEGITEMQIKLIGVGVDGAKRVLAAPRFAAEVLLSNTDDESAVQNTSFTALENAVAKASAVYNIRLTKLEVDENCIFRAYYADGTIYETDAIQKMLLQQTTDIDLTSLIKDGLVNFTVDEVVEELDERYNYAFAKAIYSDNLAKVYDVPTFVRWDKDTANTPFNANPQLTEISDGFAMCYGDTLNHTIVAWVVGDKGNDCFTHKVSEGIVLGWDSYINKSGGTMIGKLGFGGGKGFVDATEEGIIFETPTKNVSVSDGESKYSLYGTHNLPYAAQIYVGSYVGTGGFGSSNPTIISDLPFTPKILIVGIPQVDMYGVENGLYFIFYGESTTAICSVASGSSGYTVRCTLDKNECRWYIDYASLNADTKVTLQRNKEGTTYSYMIIG